MSDDVFICICMNVTRGEIVKAIREGCHSVDKLKETLYCCTGCGTCENRVKELLEQELAANQK